MAQLRARSWSPIWAIAAVLIAALAIVATTTPLRGSAYSEPTVLRPERFVAVSVEESAGTMRAAQAGWPIPGFGETMFGVPGEVVAPQRVPLDSVAAASRELRRQVRVPEVVPESVAGDPEVTMFTASSASYTLDLPKIHQFLANAGITDLQLPTSIHGATIVANVPAGVVLKWGDDSQHLVVAQLRQPSVTVPGQVDLVALHDLMLAYPAFAQMAPDLVAQLRDIEQWTSTVPVPVPSDQVAESVRVDGAPGLLVRDPRHVGGVVLWQRAGVVYAVGGTTGDEALLAAANSLR
jgi:hypothetical protein